MATTAHLRGLRTLAAAAVAAGALALPLASASAASCPTAQSFASYGDTNSYALMPNGSFEAAGGWTLTGGASIVSNASKLAINVPGVTAAQDTHSLLLPSGATAQEKIDMSCYSQVQPPLRFAMANAGASNGSLQVWTIAANGTLAPLATLTAGASWAVSPSLAFTVPNGAFGFQFQSIGTGASFRIDDVLFDPFKGR
jgi:hypothetical protein